METNQKIKELLAEDTTKYPFNYQYICTLVEKDNLKDTPIYRVVEVASYKNIDFPVSEHHKPISKIVDYSNFFKSKSNE